MAHHRPVALIVKSDDIWDTCKLRLRLEQRGSIYWFPRLESPSMRELMFSTIDKDFGLPTTGKDSGVFAG